MTKVLHFSRVYNLPLLYSKFLGQEWWIERVKRNAKSACTWVDGLGRVKGGDYTGYVSVLPD
jgi:hypothetical protein